MKLFLILAVVLVGVWLWRSSRPVDPKRPQAPPKAGPEPQEMIPCTLCSVHIPAADAIQGRKGWYCSTDHLHRAEP